MTAVNPVETVVHLAPETAADFSDILVVNANANHHTPVVPNAHHPGKQRWNRGVWSASKDLVRQNSRRRNVTAFALSLQMADPDGAFDRLAADRAVTGRDDIAR